MSSELHSFDDDGFGLSTGQIQDQEGSRIGTMQSAGIDDPSLAGAMLIGEVRMTVEEEVKVIAIFDVSKELRLIAMQKSKLDTFNLQIPKRLMQGLANPMHGLLNAEPVTITIAEDEMSREALEEPDGFRVRDVAAMDDKIDVALLQKLQSFFNHRVVTMAVTHHGNLHRFSLSCIRRVVFGSSVSCHR